jgi:hypothetical protein
MTRRPTRRIAVAAIIGAMAGAVAFAPAAHAQQPTEQRQQPRRQQTIEIRGQVPTPQVVTVRPREAPAYSRRVLVPAFYDRDFWPSILPALQILPSDRPAIPDSTGAVRRPAAPADTTTRPPGTPPARSRQ